MNTELPDSEINTSAVNAEGEAPGRGACGPCAEVPCASLTSEMAGDGALRDKPCGGRPDKFREDGNQELCMGCGACQRSSDGQEKKTSPFWYIIAALLVFLIAYLIGKAIGGGGT